MKEVFLLKCGEIVLKGLNRKKFEDRLLANIKRRLKPLGVSAVTMRQSVIYVEIPAEADGDAVMEAVQKIFGIALICRAAVCDKTLESMQQMAESYLAERIAQARSFKVETKRGDKRFPMTSVQVSQHLGGELAEKYPHMKPDMHHPELTIHFEIRDQYAFVHAGPVPGAGGMPVGTNGRAALLLSGGIDSPVAGYMMAKRGLEIEAIHFAAPPYTSEYAKQKVISLCREVCEYAGRIKLHVVNFTHVQEEIRDKCPEEYFTIIMRRYMMKIAERLARENGCGALITGESVAQVASQTLYALGCTDVACELPVLRPVIGMDKNEIIAISRKIGTFETSILPYEDCCTVFTPRHPRTKPKLRDVLRAEQSLDEEALLADALSKVETMFTYPER